MRKNKNTIGQDIVRLANIASAYVGDATPGMDSEAMGDQDLVD